MPSTRSLRYVATTSLSHGTSSFEPGDEVPEGPTLQALLVFGDTFVTVDESARTGATTTDTVGKNKEN